MKAGVASKDVHMFKYGGLQLVYDVNSGSLHQVDDLAWEIISYILKGKTREEIGRLLHSKYPPWEIEEAWDEIKKLQEEKLLFAPELNVELKPSVLEVKSLCLFVSHACNLNCRYCFARKEETPGGVHMPVEIGKKAVDFLLESGDGRYREIDFFGGEPLLNYPLIEYVVYYAREKGRERGKEFTFTLTTNTTLLNDEIIDFLNKENISVILSHDGRPRVHNHMRGGEKGEGSCDLVLNKSRMLLEGRKYRNYYIRGTYTGYNLDFSNDVRYLLEQGFDSISLEPVVAGEDEGFALKEKDLIVLEKEYDRLVEMFLEGREKGKPFHFYHFSLDLEKGPCLYKRLSGCGAGVEYLAVAADGTLYPCHQFMGEGEFYMGNLNEKPFQLRKDIGERLFFASRRREDCLSCWARYLCGWGCAASVYFQTGSLVKCYLLGCSLQKIRLERALYLLALCR